MTIDEPISILLSSHAAKLSEAIFGVLAKGRLKPSDLGYKVANDIAVRLYLINTYLDSLPPYWIELDVEQLCHSILRDLQATTQPAKESTSAALHINLPFFKSPFNQKNQSDPETCLVAFFKTRIENARGLEFACDDLIGMLTKEENNTDELSEYAQQHLDIPFISDDDNDTIFKALQHITQCEPASHEFSSTISPSELESQAIRHPARLCLHDLPDSTSYNILVLISAIDMALWQEFCLKIQPKSSSDDGQELLGRGGFCRILEREITARLFLSFNYDTNLSLLNESQVLKQFLQAGPGQSLKSILRHYDLTPKDKVMLSYALARSYWQYYDSELLRIKWTSDTIWFMPEKESIEHEGQLPLCAYLSLPFDIPGNITPDIITEALMNHRCPRIFDIGILLLEIGLATDELVELEKGHWDGFTNKNYFDRAVKFCLNSENFIPPSKPVKPFRGSVKLSSEPTTALDSRAGILARRKIFYKNVVRPLAWLAKRGFRVQAGDITYVRKKPDSSIPEEVSDPIAQPEPGALFHSAIDSRMWLQDLKRISEQVERKRRACKVAAQVRIAILDTGCDEDFIAFQGRKEQFAMGKDFVNPGATTMTDSFGHGTLMVRLIMVCAPGAEIQVVRVAENTKMLEKNRENIKEAILWAGRTGKADIISMSFGFAFDDQGIHEAIETVQKERQGDVIFLASAGNSSTDNESFPARHHAVISVYATNRHGTFLPSNSASTTNGAAVLGTYGDDIPDYIREEFRTTYPDVCQPGSSVATAIMAGISATMLIYTTILPSLVSLQGKPASSAFQRLRTTKGMEKILYRLVQQVPEHPRLNAVKPAWFWKSRPNDMSRCMAFCDALADLGLS
ncbi:hypothetical protein TRIATDRAFT_322010 [Trichoderma atroviride IMI 206040]|uniref:Uncharacterized protein n=1 Tax=Hypocrea atroviridis (strain ATCC 20476 / IMI 206040) TaxID=452589 RepID=G9P8Y4_HYPAI|nr:uncharacterized protein TRIATDRAFT_322010 [Trichoderma atroviride IMI 206040]EHK41856.1 hypothetical protein TRIATDRAFT_322010 [Trichoderma atroviride IMI 206040]